MSSAGVFTSALNLLEYEPAGIPQANLWVVASPLVFKTDAAVITVPKGFVTDLASIPRPLRAVFNVNGLSRAPAVLHDYLYCSQQFSRAEADALFLAALEARKVPRLERYSMYLGVRAGGWIYYNKRKAGQGLSLEDFVPPGYFSA